MFFDIINSFIIISNIIIIALLKLHKVKLMKEIYICPECGGNNPVFDAKRGEIICRNCGTVIKERKISTRKFLPDGLSTFHPGKKSYIGENKDIKGKELSVKTVYNFKRLRQLDISFSTQEKRKLKAFEEVQKIVSSLSLSKNIKEKIEWLILKFLREYSKEHSLRGVISFTRLAAAATYLVLKQENFPSSVGLKKIANLASISIKTLRKDYCFLLEKMRLKNPPQIELKNLVVAFCNELNLSHEIQAQCCSIIEKIEDSIDFSGKNPRGVAAAVVYLVSLRTGERRSQKEILKIADVCEVTLRRRIKEISRYVSSTIEDLTFI